MNGLIARKSDCLETEAKHHYGDPESCRDENSNEIADFEAINEWNRIAITYFGFNPKAVFLIAFPSLDSRKRGPNLS